ncbi:LamG-like jellyroll fold domain-containing protein [Luedemannella helvata]|uniref:LamG-like jellyroll fold domain-containing protein n=1 Tax=Luedemannella helvata TaxID=349315 RepID=UPI003CD07A03
MCSTADSTSALALGSWAHLAGVYDQGAGQLKIYVNGALERSVAATAPRTATGPLTIGAASGPATRRMRRGTAASPTCRTTPRR